jgi:DNA-directed RNA polymerase specialized sigma24 family protein
VAARLGRSGWRALERFPSWQERHPGQGFGDWLRIVTANALRDYVRTLGGGSTRRRGWSGPSPKRLLNELALLVPVDDLGVRPPVTEQQTALQLLTFAEQHLKKEQLAVLERWLAGESCEELAQELGLSGPAEAQRIVRAAIATLRRRFATRPSKPPVDAVRDAVRAAGREPRFQQSTNR